MFGKKGLEVTAWMVGLILAILGGLLILSFSTGLFGKVQKVGQTISETANETVKDPCIQAKAWLTTNPNKACKILKQSGICNGEICDCGDFCIKCSGYEFKGYCQASSEEETTSGSAGEGTSGGGGIPGGPSPSMT